MLLSRTNTNARILLLSLPLFILAFYQEWHDYFQLWSTSYVYSHGFLVLGGSIYLLYQRRNELSRLPTSFYWPYLLALIGLAAIFLFAHSANIKLARMVLLPMLLVAWGATLWGRPFIRVAGMPIMLIIFGAPFWDDLSPALQWLTVLVDEKALALISIPAVINEFYITIPNGVFHVDTGCSGIRYLLVALYLATFYGCMTRSGPIRTACFVAIAGFLALLSNWIRVAWIIVAGHYTDMESSLVEDHEMFGWIVFVVVVLIPFFALTNLVDKAQAPTSANVPSIDQKVTGNSIVSRQALISATMPVILIPALLFLQNQMADANAQSWKPTLPTVNSERWTGPIKHADFWSPHFHAHDIHRSAVYVNEGRDQLQLDFFGYDRQKQGKEIIYYNNSVFDTDLWKPISEDSLETRTGRAAEPILINEVMLMHKFSGEKAVVWYWYDIAGSLLASESEVQLIGGLKSFLGDRRAGAWILSTKCSAEDDSVCASKAAKVFNSFLENSTL
jgi:exosortase A